MQTTLSAIRWFIDLFFRARNKAIATLPKSRGFEGNNASDSELLAYVRNVRGFVNNDSRFARFRRVYNYREILEHVSRIQGLAYLDKINALGGLKESKWTQIKRNDLVGNPRLYKYSEIGKTSPTTIRYVSVAKEIESCFDMEKIKQVVEIGAGYGGQCAVLGTLHANLRFTLIDLPDVLMLVTKFLTNIGVDNPIETKTLSELEDKSYDLLISNYAFSEMPRSLQLEFVDRVLLKSQRGFMIMNSGRENNTSRSNGKLTLSELQMLIPEIIILEEKPKTGPDNYVISWGLDLPISH